MLTLPQLQKQFGKEQIAIVLLARLYFGTITADEVTAYLFTQAIDEALFLDIAAAHGVSALCYYVLTKHHISLSAEVTLKLNRNYRRNRKQAMHMMASAIKLITDLRAKNITVIPYKGPILGATYYEDISCKQSSDIDLLVAEKDVPAIEDHLISLNFTPKTTVSRKDLPTYIKHAKDLVYTSAVQSAVKPFSVEIHWRLMNKFSGRYPSYDFFSGHVAEKKGSSKMLFLTPTYDLMAVMSNHFVKDISTRFKYLTDIAAIISTSAGLIDVATIQKMAKTYSVQQRLNLGFGLIEQLIGISLQGLTSTHPLLPEDLQAALAYPVVPHFLTNKAFLKRSLSTRDNIGQKIGFAGRYVQYFFIRLYVDAKAHKTSFKDILSYVWATTLKALQRK